jgi:ABC-2 type transport system ATP-binding protein
VATISLHGLTKRYGDLVALDDVTLDVQPGAVGLLGPNGAGKSTLINVLLGHTPATAGTGTVLGYDLRTQQLAIRRRVGFVPEADCFIPGFSGVGYVAYAGRLAGMTHNDAMKRAHEILDLVELENERYRPVETYSGGMKQRVKIGQALVHDPELVLLDEPTNATDPQGRRLVLDLMRDLARQGVSILLSSHLLPDVERVCERVIVLGRGRVLAHGDIAEMREPSARRCTVRVKGEVGRFAAMLRGASVSVVSQDGDTLDLELPAEDRHELVLRAAAESGIVLREMRPQRSSLEQVFLQAIAQQHQGATVAPPPTPAASG